MYWKTIFISLSMFASLYVGIFLYKTYRTYSIPYIGYFIDDQGKPTGLSIDFFGQFDFEYLRDLQFNDKREIIARGSSVQSYNPIDLQKVYRIPSSHSSFRCNSQELFIFDMGELYTNYRYLGFIVEPKLEVDEKYLWYKAVLGQYKKSYSWSTGSDLVSLCLNENEIINSLKDLYVFDTRNEREFLIHMVNETIKNQ